MIEIKHIKFSKNTKLKIKQLEKYIFKIYSTVWDFDYFNNTPEKKLYYSRDLIQSTEALILSYDKQIIGFLTYKCKKYHNYRFLIIKEFDILKEYRGKGYSKILRNKLLKLTNPDIIWGEVHNSISAKSRDSVMHEYGYFTYWAEEPLRTEYPISENVAKLSLLGLKIFDKDNLPSYIQGIKKYTIFNTPLTENYDNVPEYNHIFKRILNVSKTKYSSAYGILVSIKKNIIHKPIKF